MGDQHVADIQTIYILSGHSELQSQEGSITTGKLFPDITTTKKNPEFDVV